MKYYSVKQSKTIISVNERLELKYNVLILLHYVL